MARLEPRGGDGGASRCCHVEISEHRLTEWHMAGAADPRVLNVLFVVRFWKVMSMLWLRNPPERQVDPLSLPRPLGPGQMLV